MDLFIVKKLKLFTINRPTYREETKKSFSPIPKKKKVFHFG